MKKENKKTRDMKNLVEFINESFIDDLYKLKESEYVEIKRDIYLDDMSSLDDLKASGFVWADEKYLKKNSKYFSIKNDEVYVKKGTKWTYEGSDGKYSIIFQAVDDKDVTFSVAQDLLGDVMYDFKIIK